ncbi:nucleotidyltransferase family protein [Streptomyces monomycini]
MVGRPPTTGIKDYDVFSFDDTDLSWETENAVIEAGREVFTGLGQR